MKRVLILFLLAFQSALTVFAQADLQPVAIVRLTKSEPITVKQIKTDLEKLAWQSLVMRNGRVPTTAELTREAQAFPLERRQEVLDAAINERLALQAAERDRISISDNEVNQQITLLKSQMGQEIGRQPTDAEFATAVKNETGQDLPAFRETIRRQAIVQKYLLSKKQSLFNEIKEPTEQDIVNAYNLNKAQFIRPDTIRFSMIQVPYGADSASKTRAKELIDSLNREIASNPSKFDEAVQRGQAPNSSYQAGDGGYLPRNPAAQQRAGENFINTAFNMNQGEVSKVIDGLRNYHIVKITETLPMKALELDEIIEPGTRVTVRQFIGMNLLQQRQQETLARATQELVTELRAGNSFQIMNSNLNW